MSQLEAMTRRAGEWLRGSGPSGEVVISSRIRLARNIAGRFFVNRASADQRREVLDRCRMALGEAEADEMLWLELHEQPDIDRQLLVERQLISRQHAESDEDRDWPRAVGVDAAERSALMINEEDHVRMACLRSGLQLIDAHEQADRLDDRLEEHLDWAYSSELGYLTACPTNVGTGLRASVMVHLPALKLSGEIDKVRRAARDMQLAVRGMFGEGSEALGDLYQISNQATLGRSEREILESLEGEVIPEVVGYELQAREALLHNRRSQLEDRVWRAWALLTHARVMSAEEVLSLLSHLRLGVSLGILEGISMALVNELFLLTQPAHLQKLLGAEIDRGERQEQRARLIRQRLIPDSA